MTVEFSEDASRGAGNELELTLSGSHGSFTIRTLAQNDIETLRVHSTRPSNALVCIKQAGRTELLTIQIFGDSPLRIIEPLDDSVTTVNATDLSGDLRVSVGSGPVTMIGGTGDDTLSGSPASDIINAAGGNDRILPGKGIDVVTFGAGSDILDLSNLTAVDLTPGNRAHIPDATFDGTAFTGDSEVDALAFGDVTTVGDLSDGLDASEFQTVDTEGNVVIDSLAAVVELSWEFSPGVDLASATDGTALLAGLGGTIQTPAMGNRQLLVAYQGGTVFVYYSDSGADTALTADEIRHVASASGSVSVGGLVASSFQ